jgi:hypothetical protein
LDLELIYCCTYEYAIAWIPFMLAGNLCYHVGVVKPCAMVTANYMFGDGSMNILQYGLLLLKDNLSCSIIVCTMKVLQYGYLLCDII